MNDALPASGRRRCSARSASGSRRSSLPAARRSTRHKAAARDRLERLAAELVAFREARQSTLKKLLRAARRPARGLSLGRRRARQELPHGRLFRDGRHPPQDAGHFHAFMRDVHENLRE
jgi:predicted ATPase